MTIREEIEYILQDEIHEEYSSHEINTYGNAVNKLVDLFSSRIQQIEGLKKTIDQQFEQALKDLHHGDGNIYNQAIDDVLYILKGEK